MAGVLARLEAWNSVHEARQARIGSAAGHDAAPPWAVVLRGEKGRFVEAVACRGGRAALAGDSPHVARAYGPGGSWAGLEATIDAALGRWDELYPEDDPPPARAA